MNKFLIFLLLFSVSVSVSAQDSTTARKSRNERKEERRQKINTMIRQAEEGALIYSKQNIFGIQFRTNGYGLFYELGRMKTNRKTMTYRLDLTEIKHQKEERLPTGGTFFGNPYIFGKINSFYQVSLGFGQQYLLGQKGNKNGVAVTAIYNGGLVLGLLKPYYLEVKDPNTQEDRTIKYSIEDSSLFLGPTIMGGAGLGKGWSEIKVKPGVFAKAGLRFDYGRFNEAVSGIEAGISIEAYSSKIPILLMQKDKQFFFQGYISLLFGHRK